MNRSLFSIAHNIHKSDSVALGLVMDGHQKRYWKGEFWVVIRNCQMMHKQCEHEEGVNSSFNIGDPESKLPLNVKIH